MTKFADIKLYHASFKSIFQLRVLIIFAVLLRAVESHTLHNGLDNPRENGKLGLRTLAGRALSLVPLLRFPSVYTGTAIGCLAFGAVFRFQENLHANLASVVICRVILRLIHGC